MKPSWNEAPKKANWLCMDGDGYWLWFKDKPIIEDGEWFTEPRCIAGKDWWPATEYPDESGIDWDFAFDTLEQRPCN